MFPLSRPMTCAGLAAALVAFSVGAVPVQSAAADASAQIRRTTYGVPHIVAKDERGLGYGIGYAYAQDNLCLLANEVLTVSGERSRYFGAKGKTLEQRDNLASDVFFTWLNTPAAVDAFLQAQPAPVRALLAGYASGFNRALAERRSQGLPAECGTGEWLRPISSEDLVRLTRRLLAEGGVGQFVEALAGAQPPTQASQPAPAGFAAALARQQRFATERGSNAVAVGARRSANGRGLLLANPHFPWMGGMRFYQMQLTIPGQLDVMGAALPGLPVVNIGFNQHLAWTHTVDTSNHFTLYRLQLDPKDPTRYLLDGKSLPLARQTVSVAVKAEDGSLSQVQRQVYSSQFGPVVQWPGRLDWDAHAAYSLRDANLENTRVLQQWYQINRADSLATLKGSIEQLQGIPWVNTLAVDPAGKALYLNQSVVPYVDQQLLSACSNPQAQGRLVVLDGSRSACQWKVDAQAAQPGIFPARLLPSLEREDFVQNSNDPAWMANPAQPLTGYSPLVSRSDQPLGMRGRFALQRLQGTARLGADDLQRMVTDDEVYLASLLLPDLLQWCKGAEADVRAVCSSLAAWNGKADLDSGIGLIHFQNLYDALAEHPQSWRVAFDPADPQHTPRGLAVEQAAVRKLLHQAALASLEQVRDSGMAGEVRWGQVQQAGDGTPVPGGPQALGVYNAIYSVPHGQGKRLVVSGTSYLQLVSFTDQGPEARGLLAFSQSSEAASVHASDQTKAFAAGQLAVIPFTEAQIKADPEYREVVISEGDKGAVVQQ
ncbi:MULTISPECIES: bifunctional acylase PvdQ [Pseudomonas]|uniref:bifunctional acylase PvdQ n=1 Tax=Pseudomonas TaxID=286 RepID=UPI000C231229|nr:MULTISPECIES: acylase [Pseudomonas]CAB5632461.1 Acyl-homoserine lactone acylase pvdQ precursor [Pseudomonas putida]MBO2923243.1 acylase [Pseudomonas asiatica]PJI72271.1 acylase [Pseudomonas sp. MR 02]WPU59123.1 acylase [Pseudomonas asiatica]CAB5638418.1 Acyl-homoserine lactone acylase pvdQ precursor [Pseudomonas putida]